MIVDYANCLCYELMSQILIELIYLDTDHFSLAYHFLLHFTFIGNFEKFNSQCG